MKRKKWLLRLAERLLYKCSKSEKRRNWRKHGSYRLRRSVKEERACLKRRSLRKSIELAAQGMRESTRASYLLATVMTSFLVSTSTSSIWTGRTWTPFWRRTKYRTTYLKLRADRARRIFRDEWSRSDRISEEWIRWLSRLRNILGNQLRNSGS